MIPFMVLNETNFKTSVTSPSLPIGQVNNEPGSCITSTNSRSAGSESFSYHSPTALILHSTVTACNVLDNLIGTRLFPEENQSWLERAVITRIWIGTTSSDFENCLELLKELFDTVQQNTKNPLAAPATHAAQTVSDQPITAKGRRLLIHDVTAVVETSRGSVQPRTVCSSGVVVSYLPSPALR